MTSMIDKASQDPSAALARIGLYARSETRFFIVELAAELRRRGNVAITLYCGNKQEIAFYRGHNGDGRFEELVDIGVGIEQCKRALSNEDELVATSRIWEKRIGTTLNFLAVSHRHLGRGYALGGYNHPRSRISENSTYADLLRHYCATLRYWEQEIDTRRLTLVINGGKELAICARLADIPFRVMNGSRYRNFHNWAVNEYFENPQFTETFLHGNDLAGPDLPFDRPYDNHLHNRKRFFKDVRATRLLKRAAYEVARHCWWRLRGYEKARGYYLSENLRYFWRYWREWQRLVDLARTNLDDLAGKPFVYFPLHIEPETALQGLSPEFFYQLSAIAAISRDLPAGVLLGVKETFGAVGRRPADFYGQIAEFKNVVLMDPSIPGFECARNAAATVTICGTAGLESALLGKRVVTFGRHNIYNVLPHVRVVTDETDLRRLLHEAVFASDDLEARKHAGQRFLKSVVANSFDMRDYDYFHPERLRPEAVLDASDTLIRGLAPTETSFTQKIATPQ